MSRLVVQNAIHGVSTEKSYIESPRTTFLITYLLTLKFFDHV